SLLVDDLGSIRILQPAVERQRGVTSLPALIEEDVRNRLTNAIQLSGWVLDRVDPVRRLSDVLPIVALNNAGYMAWRTRAEHAASPTSMTIPMVAESEVVTLSPALRPRAALLHDTDRMVEDFISLLRRRFRA